MLRFCVLEHSGLSGKPNNSDKKGMRVVNFQRGFSLVELMVAVGILSIVAVGTSMQLVNTFNDMYRTNSRANMVQTQSLIGKVFTKTSANAAACNQILHFTNGFNTADGSQNDVNLTISGTTLDTVQNSKVSGVADFKINRLYLGDTISLAPERPNSYLTNLYMVADTGPWSALMRSRPHALATIVVTLDSAGGLKECNVTTAPPAAKETCDALYGMSWNEATGECDQALVMDSDYNFTACPPGTHKINDVCKPTPSTCAYGQIARGFDLGIATNCSEPPLNPAVGRPSFGVPPPVEGQPNYQPVAQPSPGPTIPPVTATPIAGGPPTTAATTCTNPEAIGSTTYAACLAIPTCAAQMQASGTINAGNCTTTTTVAYSTPAPTATPSIAPPNDGSCACNDARISNGQYCVYCVPNVNLGYGYVDYSYGADKCVNGNLVPDSTASVDFSECSGGRAPARRLPTGKYLQYQGYQYDY